MRWMWSLAQGHKAVVQKPKFSEDYPEAAIREGGDELTLRAEEVRTLTCINSDHIEDDRWDPRLMRTCMPSAKQFHKGIEGNQWEELYCHYTEMSRAPGAKKPSESQKAKAFWAMKAGKDTMIQLAKITILEENREDWNCGKCTSKIRS